MTVQLPEAVLLRARSEGPIGGAWVAGLADAVADLARAWDLSVGRVMSGGTEGCVVLTTMADGREAVLKLIPPWGDTGLRELHALLAAGGRGYAELYRHDEARNAVLMERLGPQLAELGLPTDVQLQAICATLPLAWRQPPDPAAFMNGAAKAVELAGFIESLWDELDRPCPRPMIDRALGFADERRAAFDPDRAVLAHGDCHAWNTLLVPGEGPRRFKFVDPDGLFIEPAYDLAILMREGAEELLAGNPLALGRARCRRLGELTGVDPEPIWQWGFVERVSTGLLCLKIGLPTGAEMLAVAQTWAAEPTS